jgi:hypothetical protein
MGEPSKRLGSAGVLVERCGGLACDRAGRGSTSCPPFIKEAAQPQEAYQQEVVEKEVVYHGGSLLFWKNAERLSHSQAGELSARWRYTTRCKPALEYARQRVQRVKAHADQPPLLPTEHPRYRPDLLQQAHHAIAPQAALGLGATTEPLLTPDQEMVGKAGQEQDELLRFPLVLAPFDNPSALLVLAERGLDHGPAIVGISHGQGRQVGECSH